MIVKEVSFLFLAPDRVGTLDNLTAAMTEAEEAARCMTAAVIPKHKIAADLCGGAANGTGYCRA